jgi:hypothetical protein
VADDGDVQRVPVVDDADFGVFRGRRRFDRIALEQRSDRRSRRPRGFIQTSVDPDRLGDADRRRARRLWLWFGRLREQGEQD